MNRKAALLVFAVFILGIALGGLTMHVASSQVSGSARNGGNEAKGRKDKGQIVADLTRELTLTSEQQAQLTAILEESRAKYQAIYEQVRAQGRDRIRAILTPEQLPKFEAFVGRNDEERKKRNAR